MILEDEKSGSAERTYRRVVDIDQSQVGARMVLCDERRAKALVLNPSGARLWTLLAKPQSVAGLAACLRDAYPELDTRQAEDDVEDYLAELEREGLIEQTG